MKLGIRVFVLFLLSLTVRLVDIDRLEPQADELHWRFRSRHLVENLSKGNFLQSGKEMTHPGLTAAVIMGAGQVIGRKIGYEDLLISSRIANAVFSSFLPCLVLIGAGYFLGANVGLLAGLFTALSPKLIAFSKMAHIDSTLVFFSVACVFAYLYFLRTGKETFRYIAGILWGLSVLVKPTAVVLIPALFITKIIFKSEKLFNLKDLYALLIGKGLFILLFSRMWTEDGPYRKRVVPNFWPGEMIYDFGVYLNPYIITLLIILFFSIKKLRAFLFIPTILLIHSLNPAILDNVIRFWAWVFGLSKMTHVAYGAVLEPVKYGYLQILFTQLSEIEIVGFCLGVFFLRKNPFLVASLVVIFVWGGFLSVSSKQTIRYIVPIFPLIFIISAYGYYTLLKRYSFLLILVSFWTLYSWHPYYEVYYNTLTGGLKGANHRGEFLPLGGNSEAIEFLKNKGSVSLAVDRELFLEIKKRKGVDIKTSLYPAMNGDDYLLISPAFERVYASKLKEENIEFVTDNQILGVPTLKVYKFLPQAKIELRRALTQIGKFCEEGLCVNDQSGYLIAILKPRLKAGSYNLNFKIKAKKPVDGDPTLLHLKFGSHCERLIKSSELPRKTSVTVSIPCSFDRESTPNITAYYWNKRKLVIEDVSLQ